MMSMSREIHIEDSRGMENGDGFQTPTNCMLENNKFYARVDTDRRLFPEKLNVGTPVKMENDDDACSLVNVCWAVQRSIP